MREEDLEVKPIRGLCLLLAFALIGVNNGEANDPIASCSFASPGFLIAYNPIAVTTTTSTSAITIACRSEEGRGREILLELSPGSSQTYVQRTMRAMGTSDVLEYNVYVGATEQIFGNGSPGTSVYPVTIPAGERAAYAAVSITLRAPPRQDVHVGHYADDLVVTMEY